MSEPFQGHREGVTEGHGIPAGQGDPLNLAESLVDLVALLKECGPEAQLRVSPD